MGASDIVTQQVRVGQVAVAQQRRGKRIGARFPRFDRIHHGFHRVIDLPGAPKERRDAVSLGGEAAGQSVDVGRQARIHLDGHTGKSAHPDGVQADWGQAAVHPQRAQEPRQQAVRIEAGNAVHRGVEREAASTKGGQVPTRGRRLFEHNHFRALGRQHAGTGEAADSAADDDGVPFHGRVSRFPVGRHKCRQEEDRGGQAEHGAEAQDRPDGGEAAVVGGDQASAAHQGRDRTEHNAPPDGTHGVGTRQSTLLEVRLHR